LINSTLYKLKFLKWFLELGLGGLLFLGGPIFFEGGVFFLGEGVKSLLLKK
jgi:hypothetical protein